MLERFSLKNKVVLLTGGAGLYGRGLSKEIAAAGATLVIASRNRESCQTVASELNHEGLDVSAETLDQGSGESILNLRNRLVKKFGRIDGLVNNSVLRPMKGPDDAAEAWEASMKVNATGLYLLHRHFGEVMTRQKGGSIVNIGSIMGIIGPSPALYDDTEMGLPPPDYFFHKGGMINLTRYYGSIFGPHGVRVNCVSPGGFFNHQPTPFINRYCKQTFLGRMGNDTDIGGAVVFLLGDASLYITGVNLPVDGGYTAK